MDNYDEYVNETVFTVRQQADFQSMNTDQDEPLHNPPEVIGEYIEMGTNFNFEGYQVVRREFFAHTFEPSVTFNNYKMYVNTACLRRLPNADYVQCLVNRDAKILAFRSCSEDTRDSFAWCSTGNGKRKPKQITCRILYLKIASIMGWDPDCRYKLLGKMIHANGEYIMVFDLSAFEMYKRISKNGEKVRNSRTPYFPEEWKNQFGLPYSEHQKSMRIDTFDGYAIYSVRDNTTPQPLNSDLLNQAAQSSSLVNNTITED